MIYNIGLVLFIFLLLFLGCPYIYKIYKLFQLKKKYENRKMIVLTFDDGPNQIFSVKIKEMLIMHNIHAHFFLSGEKVESNLDFIAGLKKDGHTIGSHGYNHIDSYKHQIKGTNDFRKGHIETTIEGQTTRFYRPPFGRLNIIVLLHCFFNKIKIVFWTYDSGDTFSDIPDYVERVHEFIKKGGVLLMHDHHRVADRQKYALSFLELLIREAESQDYRFLLLK